MPAVSPIGTRAVVLRTYYLDDVLKRFYSTSNGRNSRRLQRPSIHTPVRKHSPPEEWETDSREPKQGNAPTLFERLFPDQRSTEQPSQPLEPILPPHICDTIPEEHRGSQSKAREEAKKMHWSRSRKLLRHEMRNQPSQTTVLVLRSASNYLVEEDFRRLVPKGKHMDSWTLDQGDILSVVPMRDLRTLAPKGTYYLLFSSVLSAFTYQGYATRVHRMVAAHTPSSILSPMPPPPGYLVDGMDAHAVMDAFTLVPPTQPLDLRQLNPPLSPRVQEIARYGGYAALVNREDRMPFEARITMEGPQLSLRALRHILIESAKARALGWSGGESHYPQLSQWRPPNGSVEIRLQDDEDDGATEDGGQQPFRRRTPPVYIAGFSARRALQSFVAYWHRRPLELPDSRESANEDYDSPPIANVEVLW